jgi:hypothetical protein
MTPIRIGAALKVADLPKYRDWLIADQRDLEIQDFYSTEVLAGRLGGTGGRGEVACSTGSRGGSASTGRSMTCR